MSNLSSFAFSFMVSNEFELSNKLYHVKSMMNKNFSLFLQRELSDALESLVVTLAPDYNFFSFLWDVHNVFDGWQTPLWIYIFHLAQIRFLLFILSDEIAAW